MLGQTAALAGAGLSSTTALITDGRFSGAFTSRTNCLGVDLPQEHHTDSSSGERTSFRLVQNVV